jgi:hypothetical protein
MSLRYLPAPRSVLKLNKRLLGQPVQGEKCPRHDPVCASNTELAELTAIQGLGLWLESAKEPVQHLVIDHLQTPSARPGVAYLAATRRRGRENALGA